MQWCIHIYIFAHCIVVTAGRASVACQLLALSIYGSQDCGISGRRTSGCPDFRCLVWFCSTTLRCGTIGSTTSLPLRGHRFYGVMLLDHRLYDATLRDHRLCNVTLQNHWLYGVSLRNRRFYNATQRTSNPLGCVRSSLNRSTLWPVTDPLGRTHSSTLRSTLRNHLGCASLD